MAARRRRLRRTKRTGAGIIALRIGVLLLAFVLLLATAGAASGYAVMQKWLENLPDPDAPGAFEVAQATRIYSSDGKLLAKLYLENRDVVPISKMSTDLVDAVVAIEDERFYQHNGVDALGIARAVVLDLKAGSAEQGASTITQQYIRNTILLNERTQISLQRKVREAYLAMELEKRYSKSQILEMYLNAIYFGEGAYGSEAAAQTYFAKHASEITLAEAALLAGLPQQPSRLDPYDNPDGAINRRNQVLASMYANGFITKAEHDKAITEPLSLKRATTPEDGIYAAPYFVAHVKKELQRQFDPATVFKGGLTVYTSVDMKMQRAAEQACAKKLTKSSGPEAALVAIDPRNGHVKALVGGKDYRKNKFNIATQGHRQPGSSFKTFVLVTAIEQGMPPSFMIDSASPAYIATKPKPWVVANSEGSGHGMMSLDSATRASVNTVFARVAWELGAKKVAKTAKRMGIKTPLPNYPSISLGASNVTPLEMASAYGTLANAGVHNEPVVITKVVDRTGKTIFEAKPHGERVLSKDVAGTATDVLKGVITGGTARRAAIGRPAAGKTGTSQDHRDVWFVGYTPQLVTAVWVGHRTEKPIYVNGSRAFGGTVCAPIWASFMKKALAGQPVVNFPKHGKPKYNTKKFHIARSKPPSVVGMSIASVDKKLNGYSYTVEYVWSTKPKGTVVGQTAKGTKLVLLVSKGPKPVTPPPPPPDGGGGTGGGGGGGTTSTPTP